MLLTAIPFSISIIRTLGEPAVYSIENRSETFKRSLNFYFIYSHSPLNLFFVWLFLSLILRIIAVLFLFLFFSLL
jgi:hypothetical protein